MTTEYVYGVHPVKEALMARPDLVREVYVSEGFADASVLALLKKLQKKIISLHPKKLPVGVPSDAIHQGVVAAIDAQALLVPYEDFIQKLNIDSKTALVILGELHDPHNVGAVIRSAAAFGIAGILLPKHRQVQITGTVVKVSAGTAFQIPIVEIHNVNHAIADLKDRGFWVYGLDGTGTQALESESFGKPSVLVLGNEANGIREKTLTHCDITLRIPITSNVESLNASVAAAVVFYAWSIRARGE